MIRKLFISFIWTAVMLIYVWLLRLKVFQVAFTLFGTASSEKDHRQKTLEKYLFPDILILLTCIVIISYSFIRIYKLWRRNTGHNSGNRCTTPRFKAKT